MVLCGDVKCCEGGRKMQINCFPHFIVMGRQICFALTHTAYLCAPSTHRSELFATIVPSVTDFPKQQLVRREQNHCSLLQAGLGCWGKKVAV